jgi:phosphomevalonate kinase
LIGRLEVSAPGKLVLLGEYAVLFGAPAVVAAIGRRAVVRLAPAPDDLWQVEAPGLAPAPASFELGRDGAVRWIDRELGSASFGLVESLLQELAAAGTVNVGALPPLALTLDTNAFFETVAGARVKLGLGSSAALTVALASALATAASGGELPAADASWLQTLVTLHRQVQGGLGSGVDVAASLLGGTIRFRLDDDRSVVEAAPLTAPDDLRMIFLWTGRAASTGDFLAQLAARRRQRPTEVDNALDGLGESAADGVAAFAAGRTAGFCKAVDRFWMGLERLGEVIAMPILSDEHRRLRRLAVDCGVHYKPSGAGGGDIGVGFASAAEPMEELARRASAAGFPALGLAVDPGGLSGLMA